MWRYFLLIVFVFSTLQSCKKPEISIQPTAMPIVIDGDCSEWSGPWYYFDDFKANLALTHDDRFLYFCLKTSDRQLFRQIMGRGLILWFNPQGKKQHTLGLVYPLAMQSRPNPADFRPQTQGNPTQRFRDERWQEIALSELEIRQGKPQTREKYSVEQLNGLAVKFGLNPNEIVYELRIPLVADSSSTCAIEPLKGKPLALGIEIPAIDISQMRQRFGEAGRGGRGFTPGDMPMGERGGGMPGGMRGQGRPSPMENVEVWLKVRLQEK